MSRPRGGRCFYSHLDLTGYLIEPRVYANDEVGRLRGFCRPESVREEYSAAGCLGFVESPEIGTCVGGGRIARLAVGSWRTCGPTYVVSNRRQYHLEVLLGHDKSPNPL